MDQVPRPLSTPHQRLGRHQCPPVLGLARQLTQEIPTLLFLIYPPGQLECPLHCLQEYPGNITQTCFECQALGWWIGTAGNWLYWLVVYWESVVHDYLMIFPCMFPPPPQNLFPVSLSAAEDPRLLPTDPQSYDLQSLPCLIRHTHTLTHTPIYTFIIIFTYFFHVSSFNYALLLLELVI